MKQKWEIFCFNDEEHEEQLNFDVWIFGKKVVNNQQTDNTRIENKEYEQQER